MADLKDWSLHYNGKFFWVRGYVYRKYDVNDGTPVTTSAIIRVDKDKDGLDIYTGHSYYRCDYELHAQDRNDLSYKLPVLLSFQGAKPTFAMGSFSNGYITEERQSIKCVNRT